MRSVCSLSSLTRALLVSAVLFVSVLTSGCASSAPSQRVWPEVSVLPNAIPKGLDTSAPTSVLRKSPDGFVYIVGGLDEGAKPGQTFLARYSGDWPLTQVPRPPMAAGQIVRTFGDSAALVEMYYALP